MGLVRPHITQKVENMYYKVNNGRCHKHARKKNNARWNIDGVLYCQKCANWWFKRNPGERLVDKYPRLRTYRQKQKLCCQRIEKLKKAATYAELCFMDKLKKTGVKFKFQRGFIKGDYFAIVDFYIQSKKLAIEIDGGYHQSLAQTQKDNFRDKWLSQKRGVKVVRITNDQAVAMTQEQVQEIIGI